jgi:DNA-directed RNA polymerase subunit RPC12/RpoP
MSALAMTVDHIRTPNDEIVSDKNFILEFLRNCDKTSFESIRDQQSKLKEQSDMKPLGIQCPSCSHKYEQQFTLNMSDFFA